MAGMLSCATQIGALQDIREVFYNLRQAEVRHSPGLSVARFSHDIKAQDHLVAVACGDTVFFLADTKLLHHALAFA